MVRLCPILYFSLRVCQLQTFSMMIGQMFWKMISTTACAVGLITAGLLTGCGTSSPGMTGSKHQTMTGVSESGYPAGAPKDAESPALSSSSEQLNSHAGAPKVPVDEAAGKPAAK
jgi:hypothetical protein